MAAFSFLSLIPLACLVPAALYVMRGGRPGGVFWVLLILACVGPLVWMIEQTGGGWPAEFSAALWLIIGCSLVSYIILVCVSAHGWRLGGLLLPYLVGLGILAVIWGKAPGLPPVFPPVSLWFQAHIAFALGAFAALTLSAISGLAVFLRQRALRMKRRPAFLDGLPSITDAEILELRLLIVSAGLLGFAILWGMGAQYSLTNVVLQWDHKTLLSLLTLGVIGVLLILRSRGSLGGSQAARGVLLAYLLLSLAYPGVKFVTDVLMTSL